jgi:penicillin-binding protein 1A
LLEGVVQSGTATRAQIPGVFIAGKTGTTENYGDAWFVGWTRDITVAVWVGYPDELRPMQTEYAGEPVAGGTYPALIFKDFVEQAMALGYGRREEPEVDPTLTTPAPAPTTTTPAAPSTTPSTAPSTTAPSTTEPATPAPETQAPAPAEEPAPADTAPAAPEEPAPAEPGPADPAATDSAGGTAPQP